MIRPEVQVAFQGGGAKFISMLPVAHAFQESEKLGRIRIASIAGTSAGAICAALIAAECDFEGLRQYIIDNGNNHINNLIGTRAKLIEGLIHSDGLFDSVRKAISARNELKKILFGGESILNKDELSIFLKNILETCKYKDTDIDKLKKKLVIIATNIHESRGEVIGSGGIHKAVLNSCSIPFAMRSFSDLTRTPYVDGGICENLPVEYLSSDPAKPVFAVFTKEDEDADNLNNAFKYLLKLFSVSIDHASRRAKRIVSTGYQISVSTEYSTFDFARALELIKDDNWYRVKKSEAMDFIQNFCNSFGNLTELNQYRFMDSRQIDDYASALSNITSDYTDYYEHIYSKLIVKINCRDTFLSGDDRNMRLADTVSKISRIRVMSDTIFYYRSHLTLDVSDPTPTIWKVKNITKGTNVPIRVLSLSSSDNRSDSKECLIEFIGEKGSVEKGDELEVVVKYHTRDGMSKINMGQTDFMRTRNPFNYTVPIVELTLIYPKTLGEYIVSYNAESTVDKNNVSVGFIDEYQEDDDFNVLSIKAINFFPKAIFRCAFSFVSR